MSSIQLQRYLQERAAGHTMMTAAVAAGLGIAEARLTENAITRGELALPQSTNEGGNDVSRNKPANDHIEPIPAPDFTRALSIIRTDLNPAEEKSAKIRGDQSAAWKAIEKDCHCNKKGAKFVHSLIRMDPEIRDDVLRTVYGLMNAAKIGISQDLVDRMKGSGEAPTMPVSDEKSETTEDLAALHAAE